MTDKISWYVGFDWATQQHRACLLDAEVSVCASAM